MDAQSAIDEINARNTAGNPMSVSELRALADSVDASVGNSQLLLFSGGVGDVVDPDTGFREFSAGDMASSLADGTNVRTIAHTEIATFLEHDDFRGALQNAAFSEGVDFDALYDGTNNGTRINNTSFWDNASYNLVTQQLEAGGDIIPFVHDTPANSVFSQSETRAILDFSGSSSSQIAGIDFAEWHNESFNFSNGDYAGAQTYLTDGLSQKSYFDSGAVQFFESGGELVVDTTGTYLQDVYGIQGETIPEGQTGFRLSSFYEDFNFSTLTDLSNYSDIARGAAVVGSGVLDLFSLGVDMSRANAAYQAGVLNGNETAGIVSATEIMSEWGGGFLGGLGGAFAGATLVGAYTAPLQAIPIAGQITHGVLILAGGVAGGFLGGEAVQRTIDQLFQVGRDFGLLPPDSLGFDVSQGSNIQLSLPGVTGNQTFMLGDLSPIQNITNANVEQFLSFPGNEHLHDNFIRLNETTEYFIYENAMVIREANSVRYTYRVVNLTDLVFDSETGHVQVPGTNIYLDFETNFGNGTTDTSTDNSTTDFENGTAVDGGNYQADMPVPVINGDGAQNTIASDVVTDGISPGRFELTETGIFRDILVDEVLNVTIREDLYVNTSVGAYEWSAVNMTGMTARGVTIANVDPLVLDVDGDGVELIHFDSSTAFFDVDNDGYNERTGWVHPDDAILVHDVNADGEINDIAETISEYYLAASGTGAVYEDGLQALATLDSNSDGVFDANDAAYGTLRVWQDTNADAITDAGELKTLAELNITSIDLTREIVSREEIEGNPILARSTMMINGIEQIVASVDFATNPIGYEWNDIAEGLHIQTEDGEGSAIHIEDQNGSTIDLSILNNDSDIDNDAQSVMGNVGNDIIIGDTGSNWLIGGEGSDIIQAGAGDDFISIDAEDDLANIDTGDGFDTVLVAGLSGVNINLSNINAEVALGGLGHDIIMGGGTTNVFIRGGDGNDVIIGGSADDALSGEDGGDTVDGGLGDDMLRGHRGEDVLIGDEGEDYLDGGLDDDELYGDSGEDLLKGGEGNDRLYGGNDYDVAEFSGKLDEYDVTVLANGSVQVTDRIEGRDGTDILTDVEALNFQNIKEVGLDIENPYTADDIIDISGAGPYTIAASDILSNDIDYQGNTLHITAVSDVLGGSAVLDGNGDVVFTPDESYSGVMSFKYKIADSEGNAGASAILKVTGESAEMKGTAFLRALDHPDDPLFYDQWYLSDANVIPVWNDYTGDGVHVGVYELGMVDLDHSDLVDNLSQDTIDNGDEDFIDGHTTLVAGVIGASRNDKGSIGVAYDAAISSRSLQTSDSDFLDLGILLDYKNYDIVNNSWAFGTPFEPVFQNVPETSEAYLSAVRDGRNGLGTIIINAAGNERSEGGSSNTADFNNLFAITVGAINKNADIASLEIQQDPFSNPGSNILVSAPGSNITSTSVLLENSNGSTFGNSHETTQGTSFATPLVSGVAALMLEANSNLGYRDVQEILAYSARIVDDQNTSWQTNGANNWNGGGLHFSHDYGFGNVDALAAVTLG